VGQPGTRFLESHDQRGDSFAFWGAVGQRQSGVRNFAHVTAERDRPTEVPVRRSEVG
jgi:hypothetical protein